MAEFISVELVLMVVRDVYLVSKWAHKTVRTAQRRDEHLAKLNERLTAQVAIVAGFAHLFLTDLPSDDTNLKYWLPQVRVHYEDLQKVLASGWTKLALKHDQNYLEYSNFYADALASEQGYAALPSGHTQWLIEDVSDSTSVTTPSAIANRPSGPVAKIKIDMHIPSGSKKNSFDFSKWKQDFRKTVDRYKFAAWDKPRIEATLNQMETITAKLQLLTATIIAYHPRFSPEKVTRKAVTEYLEVRLSAPDMFNAARRMGVINHTGIQRVMELRDDDVGPKDHQKLLDGISIPVSELTCATLKPEKCKKLSAGVMKDGTGTEHGVLIEYKGWAGAVDKAYIAERRKDINSLVRVLTLAQPPFYPNLLSLRGFVDQGADDRYAFIFDYPADSLHEQPLSLQDIIAGSAVIKGGENLENRSNVARQLAKSVAALHAVGWLHESICSDSVVIFRDAESKVVYEKPYLVNFEFSRPAGSATLFASAAAEHLKPYQHPERLQNPPPRYTKKHDLFSLGVVLLEVGLWKTTQMMRDSKEGQNRDVYLAFAQEELGKSMGRPYQRAVISLLSESFTSHDSGTGASVEMLERVIKACPSFGT